MVSSEDHLERATARKEYQTIFLWDAEWVE
jgi:hypothetical protein